MSRPREKRVPVAIRCRYRFKRSHSIGGQIVKDVHVCLDCKCWTANEKYHRYGVCSKKERRSERGDRRARRTP